MSNAWGVRGRTKIRPPKKIVSGEIDFEKTWTIIRDAIQEIQHKNASKLSFEELYRKAYNLVLRKKGKMLYDHVELTIQQYLLNETRKQLLESLNNDDNRTFLLKLNNVWEDHLLSMRMISDVLMYLDRVYAKEFHLPLIYDVGLKAFRDSVIKYNQNEIGMAVIDIIIEYINRSRHGEIIDKFIIKAIIYMFSSLSETISMDSDDKVPYGENYYLRYFEPVLLQQSHTYFEQKATELLTYQSGTIYIDNVTQLSQDEEARIQLYLPDVTSPKLIELMDNDLITRHMESIMKLENDGLRNWISENNFKMLASLYRLIGRVDSEFEMLKRQLRLIVLSNCENLNSKTKEELDLQEKTAEEQDPDKRAKKKSGKESATQFAVRWIQNFLDLKEKYDVIIKNAFDGNPGIVREVESSVSEFLNSDNKTAEYLSLYIDDGIKKSFKDKSQEEVENLLDKSIIVFRFIKEKDVFEKYYKNHLARRLLQQKSSSNDIEMNMITKLKQEIGSSFTSQFEGMFKDIKTSQDLSGEFNRKLSGDEEIRKVNGRRLDMETSILTTTFWPMPINKALSEVQYPEELELLRNRYESFYMTKYGGRNLTWAPNFGTVDIRIHYPKKTYEVNMSTYSAIIILTCFREGSDKQEYTFEEIHEITRIPKPDLIRHLQSISVASRTRLLKKDPMSKDIRPMDVFSVNEQFKSPQTKIKVSTVSSGSKVEDDSQRSETMDAINKSRILETEAAVVRIMKARRQSNHQELVNEVIRQLISRFKPQPSFIKQRIEDLIEKEYLARDEADRNIYHYLA
ncbi:hypothetical protein KL918_000786 [Ogataea parapolymorpha]|uniref:Cullin n=1 Tax=Ogataea parapolymorpha (strain ATCC 26012 / BCRC 20466 / JCM 22074 / NRRL Y-7560 / DL-1) TaxID=871575 RepID=W1QBV7_OGAPD|nr:Cullin [Ogataea parapolymorpha DL-1]ESW97177.1 Cullin [Ogataea parapolymorpha DL-1]KAG7869241.1 hypothetical protein KL918_000786 [Ogataea parapolymorpha]KAG7875707.1 hypothetical protein KL916_000378 [Ogataea parapolymorpha]